MFGKAEAAFQLASKAIDRIDLHLKNYDARERMIDDTLKAIIEKGDKRHAENTQKLNDLRASAMWTLVSVLAVVVTSLFGAVVWLILKLLHL